MKRVEFLENKTGTVVYIWQGMKLVDKLIYAHVLSTEERKQIKEDRK